MTLDFGPPIDGSLTVYVIEVDDTTYVSSITISQYSGSTTVGSTLTLRATTSPTSADDRHVTWSITSGSSRASIASTTDTSTGGRVTLNLTSTGSVTVRATAADGGGAYATYTFTIQEDTVFVTSISISGPTTVNVGEEITLTVTTYPTNATHREVDLIEDGYPYVDAYSTDTSTGATVSVIGLAAGTATLTFEAYDGYDNPNPVQTSYTITVVDTSSTPVTSISISRSSTIVAIEGGPVGTGTSTTMTITATTSPTTADDRGVTFEITGGTGEGRIVSQSATSTGGTAVIEGVSPGTLTITVTANDGSGVSTTTTITVHLSKDLSYDANGGTGAPSTSTSSSTTASRTTTVSTTTPTRDGYTFLGWATTSTATTAEYQPGDSITIYGDTTLYAVWTVTTYTHTLNYDANGGTGAPSSQTATNTSTTHTFTISSTAPTRTGYTFLGWATTSTATTAQYQPGGTISVGADATVTLYAVWQQNVIDITTTQGDVTLITGQDFTLQVSTNVSGCTLTVSGASWLSVSGSVVSGTAPSSPGTYDVTITASLSGYQSDSISFTITVVSSLTFTTDPSTGATAYVVS